MLDDVPLFGFVCVVGDMGAVIGLLPFLVLPWCVLAVLLGACAAAVLVWAVVVVLLLLLLRFGPVLVV